MRVVTDTMITEYPLLSRGKVRDIYEIDADSLLIVTTDRMSAFDVVMDQPIPYKGVVLNQITLFWMEKFTDLVQNHLKAVSVDDFPKTLHSYREELHGRAIIAKRAKPLPIECIVRGYITGSGWKDYQNTGKVCGHVLPNWLMESQVLEEPLFTPSTKADVGDHDENISLDKAKEIIGTEQFESVQALSLDIYSRARTFAEEKGILIADTKFEFGMTDEGITLIDEVLTPDSSRFWPKDGYKPGQSQPSFDKQFLRDWLAESGWDKTPPPPHIPDAIVEQTRDKYFEAYKRITGQELRL